MDDRDLKRERRGSVETEVSQHMHYSFSVLYESTIQQNSKNQYNKVFYEFN